MTFQKEADFEEALIKVLADKGWEKEVIKNPTEQDLIRNWAKILYDNNRGIDRLNNYPLNDTALQLTGFDPVMASIRHYDFADAAKDTPFYKEIIQAMLDYFETEHYVFTHGWIPSIPNRDKSYSYISSWREADREQWNQARWFNGMDAAQTADENKTIVCGHWHTSYGHSKYEHKGTEFGEDADFSPYYGPGIIAIDACTAFSGKVNCLVMED